MSNPPFSLPQYGMLSWDAYDIADKIAAGGQFVAFDGYSVIRQSSVANLSDGFAALALQDANGNVIIVNEGTDPRFFDSVYSRASQGADSAISVGHTPPALSDAAAFATAVKAQVGSTTPIFVTGHSLGGIEAQKEAMTLVSAGANFSGGATFGATGVPGNNAAGGPLTLIDYVDYGDPVGNYASDSVNALHGHTATTMYHYGVVKMVGSQSHSVDLEAAVKYREQELSMPAWLSSTPNLINDYYMTGIIVDLASAMRYHPMENYVADINGSSGTNTPPIISLEAFMTAFDAQFGNLGLINEEGETTDNDGINSPYTDLSYNSATNQITLTLTADMTASWGQVDKGGITVISLDPTTGTITNADYTSADGSKYKSTFDGFGDITVLKVNESNGTSYETDYTYNPDSTSKEVTTKYSAADLKGNKIFTQTINYDASDSATTAEIMGGPESSSNNEADNNANIIDVDDTTITVKENTLTSKNKCTAAIIQGDGNTIIINGSNYNLTLETGIDPDTGNDQTSFTDTIDAASSKGHLASDIITFEGHSIATGLQYQSTLNGYTDSYGRHYQLSNTTLTITKGSDALTIQNFQSGDFGIYTIQTLGQYQEIFGINDLGQAVGYNFSYNSVTKQFGGVTTATPTPDYQVATVFGINNSGQEAGTLENPAEGGASEGFINSSIIVQEDSHAPFGLYYTNVQGINNLGQVAGYYIDMTAGQYYGFGPGGKIVIQGAVNVHANGINDKGEVVGYYEDSAGNYHGFVAHATQNPNAAYACTTIDDLSANAVSTFLFGINNQDQMVGAYIDASGITHGFMYSNGAYITLDLPGATNTYLYAINNTGQIGGRYTDSNGHENGFITDPQTAKQVTTANNQNVNNSDNSNVEVSGNSNTVTNGASSDLAVIGNSNTATVGANSNTNVIGNSNTVSAAINSSVSVSGGGNTVTTANGNAVSFSGNGTTGSNGGVNTANISNGRVNIDDYTDITINGSTNTVNAGNQDTITISGSNNSIAAGSMTGTTIALNGTGTNNTVTSGSGNTLKVTGNGQITTGLDTLNATSDTVKIYSSSSAIVNGNGNTITSSGNNNIYVNGNTNTLSVSSANNIYLSGGGNNISAAIGDVINISGNGTTGTNGGVDTVSMYNGTINMAANADVLVNADHNIINAGDSDTLSVVSSSNTITAGNNEVMSINGSYNKATITGTGSVVTLTGTGISNTVTAGSGNTIKVTGNGQITTGVDTLNATSDTVQVFSTSSAKVIGATNTISTNTNVNLTVIGNANTISAAAGNTITINGGGNTITAANGDTINISGNGITGANGGIDTVNMYYGTINISANTDVKGNYSGNTINAANNDTVIVAGNANTVTSTGSTTSISVTGNNNIVNAVASDTVTIAGNGDTVNTTGVATISLSGYSNTVNAYSSSTVTLATNATATVNGSNLTIQGNGNHYQFARGNGQDILINGLSTNTGPSGELDMGANIAKDQIWFERVGNNLQVDILGTTDHMTINNWYSNSYSQLSSIHTAAGNVIDTQIAQLVQAMATYSTNHTGFNPTTATAMPTDPTLQSTLAASWH